MMLLDDQYSCLCHVTDSPGDADPPAPFAFNDLDFRRSNLQPRATVQSKSQLWTRATTKSHETGSVITLRIGFLDGTEKMQQLTLKVAQTWLTRSGANLKFVVTEARHADIRISYTGTNWSTVGTEAARKPLAEPTMSLGTVAQFNGDDVKECRYVILHEFGHALGFQHEMLNPTSQIEWNEDRIVDHFMSPAQNSWGNCRQGRAACLASVRQQITEKLQSFFATTPFDRESVMTYVVPDDWVRNGPGIRPVFDLSQYDRDMLLTMYPT